MSGKRIYIAGPIKNDSLYKDHFKMVEEKLKRIFPDAKIVNPTSFEFTNFNYADYMKADIQLLIGCDTIYLLHGWEMSKGAKLEHDIATMLDMSILYAESIDDYPQNNLFNPEIKR